MSNSENTNNDWKEREIGALWKRESSNQKYLSGKMKVGGEEARSTCGDGGAGGLVAACFLPAGEGALDCFRRCWSMSARTGQESGLRLACCRAPIEAVVKYDDGESRVSLCPFTDSPDSILPTSAAFSSPSSAAGSAAVLS